MVNGPEAAAERIVQPKHPASAWGGEPLSFELSVPLPPAAIEKAASKYRRIWLVSALADLTLYPALVVTVTGALRRAAFTPGGTTHFRAGSVTEEARK